MQTSTTQTAVHNEATILVVEDDSLILQGIRDILELQNYRVTTATSGLEGLEVLRHMEDAPDLIVSDIMMPYMNGYEFFKAVRQRPNWTRIPFIFLTAMGKKTDIRIGKMLGVDEYVVKPFEAEDLIVTVTSKLRRHRELNEVQQTQVSTIKRNILTILNHEFRTPLTYIVAYADMLNQDANDLSYEEMKTFLSGINAGADRLRRLIENFILLVELETGEAANTYQWRKRKLTEYSIIVRDAIQEIMPMAHEKEVRVEMIPLPPDLPVAIGDAQYLQTALIRLLDNAIKFTLRPGEVVYISVSCTDNHVLFTIEDHGRGIAPHEQQEIFDIFYQINRHEYEDQGAGAGLPIVNRIALLHGGFVQVESELGRGSKFALCIPTYEPLPSDVSGVG